MNAVAIHCPVGYSVCPRPEVPIASLKDGNGIPTCGSEGACGRKYCAIRIHFPCGEVPWGMESEAVLLRCGL